MLVSRVAFTKADMFFVNDSRVVPPRIFAALKKASAMRSEVRTSNSSRNRYDQLLDLTVSGWIFSRFSKRRGLAVKFAHACIAWSIRVALVHTSAAGRQDLAIYAHTWSIIFKSGDFAGHCKTSMSGCLLNHARTAAEVCTELLFCTNLITGMVSTEYILRTLGTSAFL